VSEEFREDLKFPNAAFDVVAVATSAGGLKALTRLVSLLPGDFPAALLIVQHISPQHPSVLSEIVSRSTVLTVKQAKEGDVVRPSAIFIAPPNQHLMVTTSGILTLSDSELVHFVRPSADVLFKSVADVYGSRAIGVILTGTGVDGSAGIQAIKQMGGMVIAQDESTSEFFGMPRSAISTGSVDLILPLDEIATTLLSLVTPAPGIVS
jgi:two-component system, chemotaxis family, protein-glutamate methylesterase/glutaminase